MNAVISNMDIEDKIETMMAKMNTCLIPYEATTSPSRIS
jgi:hypothetical protein